MSANNEDGVGGLSRLPDDPEYWDGLADRVMVEAGPIVRARMTTPGTRWSHELARRWIVLSAGAAAAVIAAVATLPEPMPAVGATVRSQAPDPYGLLPADPFVSALLAESPPSLAVLLVTPTAESTR